MSSNPLEPEADTTRLRRDIEAYHVSALVYATAKLKIADRMAAGPRTAEDLACDLGLLAPHLFRFLRVLATIGICDELPGRGFALTPLGRLLTSDSPSDLREKAMIVVEQYWRPWADLVHTLQTGRPAFEKVFGSELWQWRRAHPEQGAVFDSWLAKVCSDEAQSIVASTDFSRIGTVADIGGGNGALLLTALKAYPHLKGILFDHPRTVEAAASAFRASAIDHRVQFLGGDFMSSVAIKADLYMLKSVLHDWDDADCLTILRNCRAAMADGTKLLVIERLLPERAADDPAAIMMDMHMMVVTGGKERSLAEHRALLVQSGFVVLGETPLSCGLSIIEAAPA